MPSRLMLLLCFVVCTLLSVSAEASQAGGTARELLDEVERNGARNTVLRLYGDRPVWIGIIEHIASGQSEWIDLALRLKPGSGGASNDDLRDAMFRALARNPTYVLTHAQPAYPLATLCVGRIVPLPTYEQAAAELASVEEALDKVRVEALRYKKELCLAELREGRARLRRSYGPGGK